MTEVLNFIGSVGNFFLPIFVFLTMFNVGLTRTLDDFKDHLSEWRFYLRMIVVNFLLAPLMMLLLLKVFTISEPLEAGLIIFSMAAGAPFVIKLTQFSEHDIAFGATLLIVLVLATSLFVPIALPLALPGVSINALEIFFSLARQLILPIIIGLLVNRLVPGLTKKMQPWIGKLGTITLWIVVFGILIGELEGIFNIFGEGAILLSVIFILSVAALGYFIAGKNGHDHLQDLGALGTGQRNTAACMIIAVNNFRDTPEVLLIITIANTLGIIMLVAIAKYMSRDNKSQLDNII